MCNSNESTIVSIVTIEAFLIEVIQHFKVRIFVLNRKILLYSTRVAPGI
ncbi:hypothetical protein [Staphylococcus pettenkoferi]|nr:hypothetical protein [Staphylococcus pettenkoferi]